METKLYPTLGKGMDWLTTEEYSLSAVDVRNGLMRSLKALNTKSINMFYLHGPDRKTPLEVTLAEVDKLHKEGYFTRFGISNFMSWEVASICEICRNNNWIQPTVYQGIYNALARGVETELVPCLRFYGIALYAFQPLAGGFLTGKYQRNMEKYEAGSRFDPDRQQGKLHQGRYFNDAFFNALDLIKPAADKHGLKDPEIALRWLANHSVLDPAKGDAVIIGASSAKQLEQNLVDLESGPLPEDVVEAVAAAWLETKGVAKVYFH
jgi:aflatoxin B1 aldehyde reductase